MAPKWVKWLFSKLLVLGSSFFSYYPIFDLAEFNSGTFRHLRELVTPNFGTGGGGGPKLVQNGAKMGIIGIFQTFAARKLIFVPTTLFSYQRSSILELPDTSEDWLTQILAPGSPKLVRNGAKMGKMAIF
jgi:hypothetical protein